MVISSGTPARLLGAPAEVCGGDGRLGVVLVVADWVRDVGDRDADLVPVFAEEVGAVTWAVHPERDRLSDAEPGRSPGEVLAGAPGRVAQAGPVPADPPSERLPLAVVAKLMAEVADVRHRVRVPGCSVRQARDDVQVLEPVGLPHVVDPLHEPPIPRPIVLDDSRCARWGGEDECCEGYGDPAEDGHRIENRLDGRVTPPSREGSLRKPVVRPIRTRSVSRRR